MAEVVGAIDGGGTKTEAAWANRAGAVWLAPPLPGCNPQDNPHWADTLHRAIGSVPAQTTQFVLGLPGYGEVPTLDAAMLAVTEALLPGRAMVMNDVALAYRGCFPDGGGVLVLAGTGSMAMASGPNGLVRTGGWGDAFGDEGSGYWIGRAALATASRMIDGRAPDTGFAGSLAVAMGLPTSADPFALLGWVMARNHQRSAIASIARLVDGLAERGDPTATSFLHQAAGELHLHLTTAAQLAKLAQGHEWACAGSVFNSATLSAALTALVGKRPLKPQLDALGGGLWLAAQASGWSVGPDWITSIAAALSKGTPE